MRGKTYMVGETVPFLLFKLRSFLNEILLVLLLLSLFSLQIKLPIMNCAIHNFLIPSFSLALIIANREKIRETMNYHRLALIFFAFFYIWIWISALSSEFMETAIKYNVKYSPYFIVFIAFLILTYKNPDKFKYLRIILWLFMFLAIFGIVEFFHPNFWLFKLFRSPEPSGFYPRISSFMKYPNQYGVIMSLGVILGVSLYKKREIKASEFYVSFFLFAINSVLAGSRNGWLIFIVGLPILLVYKLMNIRTLLLVLPFWIITLLLFSNAVLHTLHLDKKILIWGSDEIKVLNRKVVDSTTLEASMSGRVQIWKAAIKESFKKPITGMGIEVFGKHVGFKAVGFAVYHTHNIILNILIELGAVGLILFLGFVYNLLKKAKLSEPIFPISILSLFIAQTFDYFLMHDYIYTITTFFFLASAGNSIDEKSI